MQSCTTVSGLLGLIDKLTQGLAAKIGHQLTPSEAEANANTPTSTIWVRFGFDKDYRTFRDPSQACYAYRRMTDLACVNLSGSNS